MLKHLFICFSPYIKFWFDEIRTKLSLKKNIKEILMIIPLEWGSNQADNQTNHNNDSHKERHEGHNWLISDFRHYIGQ